MWSQSTGSELRFATSRFELEAVLFGGADSNGAPNAEAEAWFSGFGGEWISGC